MTSERNVPKINPSSIERFNNKYPVNVGEKLQNIPVKAKPKIDWSKLKMPVFVLFFVFSVTAAMYPTLFDSDLHVRSNSEKKPTNNILGKTYYFT